MTQTENPLCRERTHREQDTRRWRRRPGPRGLELRNAQSHQSCQGQEAFAPVMLSRHEGICQGAPAPSVSPGGLSSSCAPQSKEHALLWVRFLLRVHFSPPSHWRESYRPFPKQFSAFKEKRDIKYEQNVWWVLCDSRRLATG